MDVLECFPAVKTYNWSQLTALNSSSQQLLYAIKNETFNNLLLSQQRIFDTIWVGYHFTVFALLFVFNMCSFII